MPMTAGSSSRSVLIGNQSPAMTHELRIRSCVPCRQSVLFSKHQRQPLAQRPSVAFHALGVNPLARGLDGAVARRLLQNSTQGARLAWCVVAQLVPEIVAGE